ncbi:MAG: glyoxalase [Verrucomicrobiales bacterium]|nr:glyoxalase [Verrucomicrobiales bacterium]|tara:strand:+ start:535 stop:1017 length:483 start_codon:yes stop_codon:yes gene_type:complete
MFEPRISIITLGVANMARAIAFYRDGLGFPTNITGDTAEWAVFRTAGTRIAIYPKGLLAADIAADHPQTGTGFGGITLAHNVRSEAEVAQVLEFAVAAGGTLLKPGQPADWGGHSGYFADPDGYPWEVAFNPNSTFDEIGAIWGGSLGEMPEVVVDSTLP